MPSQEIQHFQFPAWYSAERETEKTIQKLKSLKELDYYLQNPDEFIRRLAILRIQKVSTKEAVYILKDIIDSPAETSGNKYISEWILSSLLKGKDDVLLMGSRYANKLTGSERYDELFPVISEKTSGSVNFNFDSSPSHSALILDEEDTVFERDVYFESEFDFGQWLRAFIVSASANFRNSILAVPAYIGRLPKKIITQISERKKSKPVKIKKGYCDKQGHASAESENPSDNAVNSTAYAANPPIYAVNSSAYAGKPSVYAGHPRAKNKKLRGKPVKPSAGSYPSADNYYSLRSELYRKQSFFTYVKKGAFQLLYGLLFPVRFIKRHKFLTFAMLLTVFLLLANTDHGRAFTTKYFSLDLKTTQTVVLQKLKIYTSYLSNGFNRLTGIDQWSKKSDGHETTSVQAAVTADLCSVSKDLLYTVTAKNGLNMRVSPNPSSKKVGNGSLEFGSTVVFLEKKEKDTSGITWYYVKAADGRIGWVSSRYLKKKEG